MTRVDSEYFERRALQERRAAESASDARARHCHAALAERLAAAAKDGVPAAEVEEPALASLSPDFKIIPPLRR